MKNTLITTAIDYVNGKPHVGHAIEKIQADIFLRYVKSVRGDNAYGLMGSDENSIKTVQGAQEEGMEVQEFATKNAQYFIDLKEMLNLSYDQFMRTTEARHFKGAQKLWGAFKEEDIYKKHYTGLYCSGCEEFKLEKDLNEEGECPEHLKKPETVEEENYFFKLSNYGDILKEKIQSGELKVLPKHRKNEVLSFIEQGLEDFSISRSVERARGWGVPVAGDDSQIMYVWVDALSNYITALDYASEGENYQTYWENADNRIHMIGKGILRFHAIYWPAMLLSAGVKIPTDVYAHEYVTINNQKVSKSLGNIINPDEVVEKFGIDGARYVLVSALPSNNDGDISWDRMTEKYNADLANGLGNLVSRVVTLLPEDVELHDEDYTDQKLNDLIESFQFASALEYIWTFVAAANKKIEDEKPWELKKTDPETYTKVMTELSNDLLKIASLLNPFLPETAQKIKQSLINREKTTLFQRID